MHKTNYPSITKFQELVELKDYRKPTKKEYVRYVRKLAEHFQCDPATLTEDQLRQYFLFLREHKHYSRSPMQMAKYALLCFYVECLKVTGWTVFRELRIAQPQVLPIVLSRTEVKSVLRPDYLALHWVIRDFISSFEISRPCSMSRSAS